MHKNSIVKYITKFANHCFCCFIFTRFENYNFTHKKINDVIITGIRYPSYSDYDYDIGPPYGQIGPSRLGPAQLDPPKDLPENVEEALGTINNYLANPNQNVSDTTTTTKKPKRITTTVAPKTTIRTTTKPSIKPAVPTTRKLPATTLKIPNVTSQPKRKKPTSSIDDAKENSEGNNNVTIKSCM